jgi:hypothetical protein
MTPFFIKKFLDLGRQFGQINFGAFGSIFSRFISTHFGSVFFINQSLFLQKRKPYIQIPNKYLGFWYKGLVLCRNND